jgi:hypothetical protein
MRQHLVSTAAQIAAPLTEIKNSAPACSNGSSKKSLDELRFLVAEFESVSPFFSSVEWELLDRARARLAQLEAEAMR